jgi:hypothetical protein
MERVVLVTRMSLDAALMERVLLGVLVRKGAHARTPNLAAVMTEEPQLKALMTWDVAVLPVSTDAVLMATAQQMETTSWGAGTRSFPKHHQRCVDCPRSVALRGILW